MDITNFDLLTCRLGNGLSRRDMARWLAVACGFPLVSDRQAMAAGSKGKRRKKLKRNQYGCVAVGGKCQGRDKNCCSGWCKGKNPKKGERDKSRCVAHDTGTIENGSRGCLAGDDSYGPGETLCTTSAGEEFAQCWRTTGDAGFCGFGAECIPGGCRKDADCVGACGAGAACVVLPDYCQGTDTVCFGVGGCP